MKFDRDRSFTVGVDLGGTNLRIAAYEPTVGVVETIVLPTRLHLGPDQVVRDMCGAIQSLVVKYSSRCSLIGVGVGAPGPLELPEGIVRNPPNMHGWNGFHLKQAIEDHLHRPIVLESDGNLAALAEHRLGAGHYYQVESLCTMTMGTGVGGGILNGSIWHGFTGMGAECGHIVVDTTGGVPCGCGGFGCVEQYASATAVARIYQDEVRGDMPLSAADVAMAAMQGDDIARGVFEGVGRYVGLALSSMVNALNLPLYLLGGGVSDAWSLFAPKMFDTLSEYSYVYRLTRPQNKEARTLEEGRTYILPARLGKDAGLLGACVLPIESFCGSGET